MSLTVRPHRSPPLPDRVARGEAPSAAPPPRARWREGDVVVALLVLWVASAARVAGAVARREVFGAEATLALIGLLLAPRAVLRARRAARPPSRAFPRLRLVTKEPPRPRVPR